MLLANTVDIKFRWVHSFFLVNPCICECVYADVLIKLTKYILKLQKLVILTFTKFLTKKGSMSDTVINSYYILVTYLKHNSHCFELLGFFNATVLNTLSFLMATHFLVFQPVILLGV